VESATPLVGGREADAVEVRDSEMRKPEFWRQMTPNGDRRAVKAKDQSQEPGHRFPGDS
jgi:hypothetical protein